MANIKSAKKSIKTDAARAISNTSTSSKIKTDMKKVEAAVQSGDKDKAEEVLKAFISDIDSACAKGNNEKNINYYLMCINVRFYFL